MKASIRHCPALITENEPAKTPGNISPDSPTKNLVICVTGVGGRSGFSVLMTDTLPCLDMIEKGQCFPLFLYGTERKKP